MSKALTVEFKAFGFFTVALSLSMGASLVTADRKLMSPIIPIIICAVESFEDLVENLFGGERAGLGQSLIDWR